MTPTTNPMKETISRPYFQTLRDYGARHPDVVSLMGDLTKSCEAEGFEQDFPERYFNLGMAEQNLIGVAGGMAHEGLRPLVHTFGVFISRRAYDQVQMAIGVTGARVRLMGFLPGVTTPGGVTHQAIDDVAVMGSVPGMTIVDPGDATEIRSVLDATHDVEGPVYARMIRGDVPVLFEDGMTLGKVRIVSEGTDVALVSSSVGTWESLVATETLKRAGLSVAHVHLSTLKPLDDPRLLDVLSRVKAVVTVENHLVDGGLGSAVAVQMAENGIGARLGRLGLHDRYGGAGSLPFLVEQCGFSAAHVVARVGELLDLDLGGTEIDGARGQGEGDLDRQEAL